MDTFTSRAARQQSGSTGRWAIRSGHEGRGGEAVTGTRDVPNHCRVSFTDSEGITHCAEVAAESLYEAAVLALAEFDRCGLLTRTPARRRGSPSRCWLRQ